MISDRVKEAETMKKILLTLLAMMMTIALAACGGGSQSSLSKEEMLEQAVEVTLEDLGNATYENASNAKEQYCGKVLIADGYVRSIGQDNTVQIGGIFSNGVYVMAELPAEDVANIETGQRIAVVGETKGKIKEESSNMIYEMPVAYLVKDRYEITAKYVGPTMDDDKVYNIKGGENSNIIWKVHFKEVPNWESFTYGGEITFTAKVIENNGYEYLEAELVE